MGRGGAQWTLNPDQYRGDENVFDSANADTRPRRLWRLGGDPLQRDSLSGSFKRHGALSFRDHNLENTCSIETRRDWEARQREILHRIQLFKHVVEKYLVKRAVSQQLAFALHKWQRAAQIETSLGSYQALVRRHRAFYLRKALLRTCWSNISRAFLQWRQFTDRSARALREVAGSYERQLKRLMLGKWYHRLLLAGRLEEQAAASVWMRRQHQQSQAVERKLQRVEKQLLVSYWINWRSTIREWRCRRSDRRLRFQSRQVLVEWTRFVTSTKQERERRREPVRAIVEELIQTSIYQAQVKQTWVTKAQQLHRAVRVMERVTFAYQRQSVKQSGFQTWRAASAVVVDRERFSKVFEVQSRTELREARLPQRISALYRRSQVLGARVSAPTRRVKHRPQWR